MLDENIAQLRSAKVGRVTCPLKTDYPQQQVPLFECQECKFHKGAYRLPKTVAIACTNIKDNPWQQGINVLPLKTIYTLPSLYPSH